MKISYITDKLSAISTSLFILIASVIPFNLLYVLYKSKSFWITNIDILLSYFKITDFAYTNVAILLVNSISVIVLIIAILKLPKLLMYTYVSNQFTKLRFSILYILISIINIGLGYISIRYNTTFINAYATLFNLIVFKLVIPCSTAYVVINNNKVSNMILTKSKGHYKFIINKNSDDYIVCKYQVTHNNEFLKDIIIAILLGFSHALHINYNKVVFGRYKIDCTIEIHQNQQLIDTITFFNYTNNVEDYIKESINKSLNI